MKRIKITPLLLAVCFLFAACGAGEKIKTEKPPVTMEIGGDARSITLSDEEILVDGQAASQEQTEGVYVARDIVYYKDGQDFTYGEGTEADAHSQEEADKHTVVHITKPGQYVLSGKLSAGQVAVDLGEDAEKDPQAVVTLVLNGVDITCTVAPAVIFYNVYECGSDDESSATKDVDTKAAGANVLLADGKENNIRGSYVARIYKSVELNEEGTEVVESKKLHKYDGAFYSKMSMNIYGGKANDGVLNIQAENEGLDSELHLTVYSGNIRIRSGNDGINANEDNVSVVTVLGGSVDIVVEGGTGEGDGIDSNGYLVLSGGQVTAAACGFSGDAGIDADLGVYLTGCRVVATGNMFDRISEGSDYAVFTFGEKQSGGQTYRCKTQAGKTVLACTPANDFTYLVVSHPDLTPGSYTLWQGDAQLLVSSSQMGGRPGGERPEGDAGKMPENGENTPPELPENMTQGQPPEKPEGKQMPNMGQKPEGGQMPDMGEPPVKPEGNGQFAGQGEAKAVFEIVQGGNPFFVSKG